MNYSVMTTEKFEDLESLYSAIKEKFEDIESLYSAIEEKYEELEKSISILDARAEEEVEEEVDNLKKAVLRCNHSMLINNDNELKEFTS